jgi:hypothetical protein
MNWTLSPAKRRERPATESSCVGRAEAVLSQDESWASSARLRLGPLMTPTAQSKKKVWTR